jgi:hypothetical protein
MTIIKNKYIGIIHPLSLDERLDEKFHDLILEAWKATNCPLGVHLFDEVLSEIGHRLHCDACGMEVYIEKVDIPDGKDNVVK